MLPDAQHRPPDTALSGVLLAHCFFSVSDAQPSYSPGPTCLRPRAQLLLLFFSIHTCWDFVPTHGCESHQDAGDPSARSPAPTSPLSSRPYVQWLTLHLCFPSNRLLLSMTCPAPNSDPHPHQTFSPKQPHPSRSGLNLTLLLHISHLIHQQILLASHFRFIFNLTILITGITTVLVQALCWTMAIVSPIFTRSSQSEAPQTYTVYTAPAGDYP